MRYLLLLISLLAGTATAINLSEVETKDTCYFDLLVINDRRTFDDPLRLGARYSNKVIYDKFDAIGINSFFTGCRYGVFFNVDYTFWPDGQFLMTAELSFHELNQGSQFIKQIWSIYRPITTQLQSERLQNVGLALNDIASAFLRDWEQAHRTP
ncbi:hypothetical protein [Deinococcus humi]|uniref:Uncharacterized protein n=1 Tax=Deinococcus humi TaxID=662880 RepID=A0A7W8JZ70_9DEIO|nr:hypothetical protein [Deinococcus humi]MBB5365932.1 hypothetical protein [Deinococcus humi]